MTGPTLSLIQGTLELLALKTLGSRGELHGLEILDWIERSTGGALVVEDGALYHALHRMEERGWLKSDWGISEKGRRAKYYQLTAAGRRALAREERNWTRYVEAVASITAHGASGGEAPS